MIAENITLDSEQSPQFYHIFRFKPRYATPVNRKSIARNEEYHLHYVQLDQELSEGDYD